MKQNRIVFAAFVLALAGQASGIEHSLLDGRHLFFKHDFSTGVRVLTLGEGSNLSSEPLDSNLNDIPVDGEAVHPSNNYGTPFGSGSSDSTLNGDWIVETTFRARAAEGSVVFSLGRANTSNEKELALCSSSTPGRLYIKVFTTGATKSDLTLEKDVAIDGLGDTTGSFNTAHISFTAGASAGTGTIDFYWNGEKKTSFTTDTALPFGEGMQYSRLMSVSVKTLYPSLGCVDGVETGSAPELAFKDFAIHMVSTWSNADGTWSFDNAANWSPSMPSEGDDVVVVVAKNTSGTILVENSYNLGAVTFKGKGTASFAGNGFVTSTKTTVSGNTTIDAKGVFRPAALQINNGSAFSLIDPSVMDDGKLTGKGDFTIDPGEGAAVTMTKANNKWIGRAIIASGTVRFGKGGSFGDRDDGDTKATILVKSGAILDQNGQQYVHENRKPAITLEEGATLTNSGLTTDIKGLCATDIILEGNATINADAPNIVGASDRFNSNPVTIDLAGYELTKTGDGEAYISVCNFISAGTFHIAAGTVRTTHRHPTKEKTATDLSKCDLVIDDDAVLRLENYNNDYTNSVGVNITVPTTVLASNVVLNGSVVRESNTNKAGVVEFPHEFAVAGSLTGHGTTEMLTLQDGASVANDGTGALIIEEMKATASAKGVCFSSSGADGVQINSLAIDGDGKVTLATDGLGCVVAHSLTVAQTVSGFEIDLGGVDLASKKAPVKVLSAAGADFDAILAKSRVVNASSDWKKRRWELRVSSDGGALEAAPHPPLTVILR